MKKKIELQVQPEAIEDIEAIKQRAIRKSRLSPTKVVSVEILKRSIDARGKHPVFRLQVEITTEVIMPEAPVIERLQEVVDRPEVIVVGAGPAGYFAALELIELGYRPIVLDRGKDVRARRRDLRAIQQFSEVNPHSNYCFGEGGAGTYSDGKLYTRSHKRGNIEKALRLLVEHGAKSDILVDAHPHIGSNKLPKIVANIRESILKCGGEVRFNAFVTDLMVEEGRIKGVSIKDEGPLLGEAVVLATGHSARDIYYLLHSKGIHIEAKPFAIGVRIEHSQKLIDRIQYGQPDRGPFLPASSYKLVTQVGDRGVFSFCMCPGGLIVPAATAPGEIVVNGMSMSRRDSAYANSGTVTAIEKEDLAAFNSHGVFAGLALQKQVEQQMFAFGNGGQQAPAQRLTDFVNGKISASLPSSSYIPGLISAPLHQLLPDFIYERLRIGIQAFGRKMRGYYTEEANVVGTESRTSAPIRIPRDRQTLMHEQVEGLFPCGEGAGYAGGILSAAMDGQNVGKAVVEYLKNKP